MKQVVYSPFIHLATSDCSLLSFCFCFCPSFFPCSPFPFFICCLYILLCIVMPKSGKHKKAQTTNAAALSAHAQRAQASQESAANTPARGAAQHSSAGNTPARHGATYSATSPASGVEGPSNSGMQPLDLTTSSPATRTRARMNRETFPDRVSGRNAGQQASAAADQLLSAVNRQSPAGIRTAAADLSTAAQTAAQAAAALGTRLPEARPLGVSPTEHAHQQLQAASRVPRPQNSLPQSSSTSNQPSRLQAEATTSAPVSRSANVTDAANVSNSPGHARPGQPAFVFRPSYRQAPRAPSNPSGPRRSGGAESAAAAGNGGSPPPRPSTQHLSTHKEADRAAEQLDQSARVAGE